MIGMMTWLNPKEAPYMVFLILPAVLLLAKWSCPRLRFRALYFCAAGFGWVLINLALRQSPPHNGFAYVVHLSLGWLWCLPLLGVFHGLHMLIGRMIPALLKSSTFGAVARYALFAMIMTVILLEREACFGRISERQAVEMAVHELHGRGVVDLGTSSATWTDGEWIVTFSGYESPVYINRLGELSGIGG